MKKLLIIASGIIAFLSNFSFAQPAIEWQKCIGGTGIDFGKGLCIARDSLAYYVTGYTNSINGNMNLNYGGLDIFLSKIDLNGNILWTKLYGGSGNDYSHSIISTHDNGILICGFTKDTVSPGTHGGFDVLLIKTDSSGNQQWKKFYGGSENEGDHFAEIIETSDMGFACITGANSNNGDLDTNYGSTDFWLFKTDSLGNIEWSKNYGGTDDEDGHSILAMPDGGFVIDGHTASNDIDVAGQHNPNSGIHDGWVVRVDSSGNIKWQKCIGGTGFELLNQICIDDAGNIVIVGYTSSNNGDIVGQHGMNDAWMIKLDTASGSLLSSKVYGGSGDDYGLYLLVNTDGSLTIGGYSTSTDGDVTGNHNGFDYWILKTDVQGNIIWGNSYGGSGGDRNMGGICAAYGDGIIISGASGSNDGDVSGNHGAIDCWMFKLHCQKPVPSFYCVPNPSCMGDTIYCTNTSTGAYAYEWYVNGSLFSNTVNASTILHDAGRDTILLVSKFESCSDSVREIISINSLPLVELGNDTSICQGCSIILNAGNPGAAFLWSTGDTTQQIAVTSADTILVEVALNGCTGSDTIIILIDTLTGVGEAEKKGFSMYPNPTSGIIKINPGITGEYFLDVLLPDSRLVRSMGPYEGNAVVQLDLPGSGCFLAVVRNREGIVAVKTLFLYSPH